MTELKQDHQPLQGRSTCLEKNYTRTASSDAAAVRSPVICKQTLAMLLNKWRDAACPSSTWTSLAFNDGGSYLVDQFKSLRQDLTVQHIKSPLTVATYEANVLLYLYLCPHRAWSSSEWGDFNQCQQKLKLLYEEISHCPNASFFHSLRILYLLATQEHGALYAELMDGKSSMCDLETKAVPMDTDNQDFNTPGSCDVNSSAVDIVSLPSLSQFGINGSQHLMAASAMCFARISNNYCAFFRSYALLCPGARRLCEEESIRMREKAFRIMVGAYMQYPLADLVATLQLSSQDMASQFIEMHQGTLDGSRTVVDCRKSRVKLQ